MSSLEIRMMGKKRLEVPFGEGATRTVFSKGFVDLQNRRPEERFRISVTALVEEPPVFEGTQVLNL